MSRAELKQLSKSQLKGNWKVPVLLMLIYSVVVILVSIIQNHTDSGLGIFIGFLITLGIEVWGFVGFSKFFLKFRENPNNSKFDDVLVSKSALLKSLGFVVIISIIGAIIGGIIGVAAVTSSVNFIFGNGGLSAVSWLLIILSIVLGVLLTIFSLAVSMTSYIIVDKEQLGLIKAMKLSIKMMKGHKWELFVIQLSFIGWAILGLITLGIGYLWLTPYMTLTITNLYKELDKNNSLKAIETDI